MASVSKSPELLDLIRKSALVEDKKLDEYLASRPADQPLPESAKDLAAELVRDGLLTNFQAGQLLAGKTRGFVITGKYRLLEHLGAGGMGSVFLCEHTSMRRRVAIKVLPIAKAQDTSYLERFYREARAVGALDHPNIVRAYDIDHDDKLHFLVMEYVDGTNLHDIIRISGPLDVQRACNYISQAAHGLQHAHDAGLVHRDVKPANLLVDRTGTVKILDLGLARFFHDHDDNLSQKYDETLLGTTDYLAPEQTLDSGVDGRADVYSLGATFYFTLTGQPLFGEGTPAQKLIWHQTRQPKPIASYRPDVPAELAEIIEQKMLAKWPEDRFQHPIEVCEALAPWTAIPIPPPSEEEMPRLCPAARGAVAEPVLARAGGSGPQSPTPQRIMPAAAVRTPQPAIPPGSSRTRPGSRPAGTRIGVQNAIATSLRPTHEDRFTTDDDEGATEVQIQKPPSRKMAAPPPSSGWVWMVVAATVLVALLAGGGAAWWLIARAIRGVESDASLAGASSAQTRQARYGPNPQPQPQAQPPAPPPDAAMPKPGGPGNVAIKNDNGIRHVKSPNYEATVDRDGCLTSLRVGGTEMLWVGGPVSRGSYLFEGNGPVKLGNITDFPKAPILVAKGDRAEIRYDMLEKGIAFKVTNNSEASMPFFFIFDTTVRAVNNGGVWMKLPIREGPCSLSSWYAGRATVKISGGSRTWGPFEKTHQVWEALIPPRQTHEVVLEVGTATEDQMAQVARVTGEQTVHTAAYDAIVDSDGCLTSLRVGGTEVLQANVGISRGGYLHQGDAVVKLSDVKRTSQEVITARGDQAEMRYEFTPASLMCAAANNTDKPMSFYLVFSPAVQAFRDAEGEWQSLPFTRGANLASDKRFETTRWYTPQAKLTVSGGSRVWGPWSEENLEVWEAVLAPHSSQTIVLRVDGLRRDEVAHLAAVTGAGPPEDVDLQVLSPLDYQVFQRYSKRRGNIQLRGKVRPQCTELEVCLHGASIEGKLPGTWEQVMLNKQDRTFDTALPAAAGGWYRVQLRARDKGKTVAEWTVDHVGVGEVFVIAGQSNSTNCGEERLRQTSGYVASFDGKRWRPGDDPQLGVHDRTAKGSPWPAFGDALHEKCHVPIGIASTGHSGSGVGEWRPGSSDYYKWMMERIRQLGPRGFRAVLWHQGETDIGMKSEDYFQRLKTIIQTSQMEAGWDFPWFVAQVSYQNRSNPSSPNTREAQKKLWKEGIAQEGPDTDTLTGDNRDEGGKGIHFSGKGLRAHGKLWADKVAAYLDKNMGE